MLAARDAWAAFNLRLFISGAFGVFGGDLLLRVGGFRAEMVGDDFDLIHRLHRYLHPHNIDHSIYFIPDSTCWTEAPSEL
jgi:biofilm PGA synthesis N-glycosyltransferase PgaC